MMDPTLDDTDDSDDTPVAASDEPRVTIEMGGPNIVIRSTAAIDQEYTNALAHAVNAAADTDMVVVIDPEPIRCDDAFATHQLQASEIACADHADCRPVAAKAIARGVIRIAAEHSWWNVDVGAGRFCQTESALDIRFLRSEDWTPVIAVCVTPTRLSALTCDDTLVTSYRAHEPGPAPVALAG